MAHHKQGADKHRDYRSIGCSFDAHLHAENKNWIQDHIHGDTDQQCIHGFMRIARGSHHIAETVTQINQYATGNHNTQIINSVRQSLRTSTESRENFREINQGNGCDDDGKDKGQNKGIAKNISGPFDVLHTQYD